MKLPLLAISILTIASCVAPAQEATGTSAPTQESRYESRYALSVIDDATFYGWLQVSAPKVSNRVLVEPAFTLHYRRNWTLSANLVGENATYGGNVTQLRIKEVYAGISVGDFDFTAGRHIVRWGTGYAFTAIGVIDPPRNPSDPTDRLNLNEGRDMGKVDYTRGRHNLSLIWSTAALAPPSAALHDTTAFRYNVLVRGFDTSLIAGSDRGGSAFGGLTFTRVVGSAWELHGEAAWREHEAVLLGAKYTTSSGITFLGELFTAPNIPYYRDTTIFPLTGRQHYAYLRAAKNRLRDLPGWKEWDLAVAAVANLDDASFTAIVDANRRLGSHFSTYLHAEIPTGRSTSQYGSTPYGTATSMGIRFQR